MFSSLALWTKPTLPPIRKAELRAFGCLRIPEYQRRLPQCFFRLTFCTLVIVPQSAGLGDRTLSAVPAAASSVAPGPSSAAPPAAVIAASALALPICQSFAAPAAPAAAQSTGLGGRISAAAAASEDPAISSVSASNSAPSRSASAAGPCLVAPGDAAAPAAVGKPSS